MESASAIAANKIAGIRCALVHDHYTAELSRQHNDANVIAMGARVIGPGVAEDALQAFRDTAFLAGRHLRRVELLGALDGQDLRTADGKPGPK